MKRLVSALGIIAFLTNVAFAGTAQNNPPRTGGGGGSITSITSTGGSITVTNPGGPTTNLEVSVAAGGITQLTGDVTAGPGTGSQASTIVASAVTLAKMANIATSSFIGRVTAGPGVPQALTAANAWTILGVQPAANFPALTGDITTTAGALATTLKNTGPGALSCTSCNVTIDAQGRVTAAANGSAGTTYTFSTGLTNTAGTITNNAITGLSGGQVFTGDTVSGGNAIYRANSAGVNGTHIFGNTTSVELGEASVANGPFISAGVATPQANCIMELSKAQSTITVAAVVNASANSAAQSGFWAGQAADLSAARAAIQMNGTGFTTSGVQVAGGGTFMVIGGSGNQVFDLRQASGDFIWTTGTSPVEKMRLTNGGKLELTGSPYASFTSSTTTRAQANGEVMAFAATPPSQASAAGALLNAYRWDAATATLTGTTHVTTATGFNFIDVEAPTITDASAVTVDNTATMTIKGGPVAAGSVTIGGVGRIRAALWTQEGAVVVDAITGGYTLLTGLRSALAVRDPLAGGEANISADDGFFGQSLVGYTNSVYSGLNVGAATGTVLALTYGAGGVASNAITVQGTGGAIAMLTAATFSSTVSALGYADDANGNARIGKNATLATSATDGFPQMPNVAGRFTGTPTLPFTGGTPFGYNKSQSSLQIWNSSGSSWDAIPAFSVTAGAGAQVATFTNLPTAVVSTTTKYWRFSDPSGTLTYVPYWQ